MVKLIIDRKPVSVPEGTTILEAARSVNIEIPTLCYLKGVNEIAACRLCMVEIEGYPRLVPPAITWWPRAWWCIPFSPGPGGPAGEYASAAQPARHPLHQVYPQRQLQAAKATNDYNLLGDHYIKDLKRRRTISPTLWCALRTAACAVCAACRCATRSRA